MSLPPTQGPANPFDVEIQDWESDGAMPSLLVVGPSGSGKSTVGARLMHAGLNVAVVDIENKAHVFQAHKPPIIPIGAPVVTPAGLRAATATEKFHRLQRLVDGLGTGKFRTHGGRPIDILFIDGLMEVGEIMYGHFRIAKNDQSWQSYNYIGDKLKAFFNACRDAAGSSAAKLGLRPIGIVATCGVKPEQVGQGADARVVWSPLLPGQKAVPYLSYNFEVVWFLQGGTDAGGRQVFRVYTAQRDGVEAKSPAGLYESLIEGPGYDTTPDTGRMYLELLTNPKSPYHQPAFSIKAATPQGENA